ncbi:MAG: hypothetical protein LBR21_07950 [Propionibacteriaceae bacterium]|jgi:uncharacterized membrane protein YesL|nr:hypothetical protein [Propionibacteriaceae bacterium]
MAKMDAGSGLLVRLGSWVYWLAAIELCLLVSCAPMLAAVFLFGFSGGGVTVAALSSVFAGPALAAACFAWGSRRREGDETPVKYFLRGYRLSWKEMLVWQAPLAVILAAVAVVISNPDAYDGPEWVLAAAIAVCAVLVLVSFNFTGITALFSFRLRDRAKLSLYYSFSRPFTTIGYAAVVVAAYLALTHLGVVAAALLSTFTMLAFEVGRPVFGDVRERFTSEGTQDELPA